MGGNSKLLMSLGCLVAVAGCTNALETGNPPVARQPAPDCSEPGAFCLQQGQPLNLGNDPWTINIDAIRAAGLPETDRDLLIETTLDQRAIFIGNHIAAEVMGNVVNAQLGQLGMTDLTMVTQGLRPDQEATADIVSGGQVRTFSIDRTTPQPSTTPGGDIQSQCVYALSPSAAAAAARPCSFLLAEALDRAETEATQALNGNPLDASFQQARNAATWYNNAANFGLGNLIAPMALTLRNNQLCDREVTPATSAFELGVDLGRREFFEEATSREPAFPARIPYTASPDLCNPESQIIVPARREILGDVGMGMPGRIDQLVNGNQLCPGFTSTDSGAASRYQGAMMEFRSGVAEGVLRAAAERTQAYMTGPTRLNCVQEAPPPPPTPPAPPPSAPPSFGTGGAGTPPWATPQPGSFFSTPGGLSAGEQQALAAAQEAQRIADSIRRAQQIAQGIRTAMSFGRMLGGLFEPLTLDLNGDGVRMEPLDSGPIYDFGNGPVRTAWMSLGDGLLVMDRDGDGHILATEMFGDVTVTEDGAQAAEGWGALALYDAVSRGGNGDGKIDENDEAFSALSIWADANGDAVVQDGELLPLTSHGINGIDLDWHRFTRSDGSSGEAVDLWFPFTEI